MRIALVSDAWRPQVNGVVRTWEAVQKELPALGHSLGVVSPADFHSIPCPTYPDIRLALPTVRGIAGKIESINADAIVIATEGPLGLAARWYCLRAARPFVTSFHTRFPEYIHARWRLGVHWIYRLLRWFHGPARAVLVSTPRLMEDLRTRKFANTRLWSRGVDAGLFHPGQGEPLPYPRPVWLYVGRVAVEKNLRALLDLSLPGTVVLVGDGPDRPAMEAAYPGAVFLGARTGEALGAVYRSADVFVFPSRTDTFGLVLLEAMASGVPVAAFPVPGPLDVVVHGVTGILDEDLGQAARRALALSREDCRVHAGQFTWRKTAEDLVNILAPMCR